MKYIIYSVLLVTFSALAGEEKSLIDLVNENTYLENEIIDTSQLNTGDLVDTDSIHLQNEVGDEGEFEARVEAMEASLFEDQANSDAEKNGCDQNSFEKIVCANIMCDFGLIKGEWPGECTDYKLKLAKKMLTLMPWEDPPNCIKRDKDCNDAGKANKSTADENYCNQMSNLSERHKCLMALDMNNKKGATEYVERNGGDASILNDVEFIDAEPAEIGSEFLVNIVDPRFNFEEELTYNYMERYKKCSKFGFKFNCRWRERDTGIQPMAELNYYLEHRDNPTYSTQVIQKRELLISKGTMLEHCANVPFNQFFNCNFYPALPQQCWSAPNHEEIAKCVEDQEVARVN